MQWTKKLENYYAVLSDHGNFYYGAGQDPLKNVMDDVDACKFNCFFYTWICDMDSVVYQ